VIAILLVFFFSNRLCFLLLLLSLFLHPLQHNSLCTTSRWFKHEHPHPSVVLSGVCCILFTPYQLISVWHTYANFYKKEKKQNTLHVLIIQLVLLSTCRTRGLSLQQGLDTPCLLLKVLKLCNSQRPFFFRFDICCMFRCLYHIHVFFEHLLRRKQSTLRI